MIKLETVSVRQVDKGRIYQFFNSDTGIKEYIKTRFQDTGRLVSMSSSISDDCTMETCVLIFESRNDYEDFESDKVLKYQTIIQTRYNKYYNIVYNKTVTEI
jgi:hypothetical protein